MIKRVKIFGIEYREYSCGKYLVIGKKWITISEK